MTPRPYLSWSSYSLFKRSKGEWKKKYLLGEESYQNKYTAFGSKMAEIRDGKEDTDDEIIKSITTFLPQYPHTEYEMTATIKVNGKKLVLFGKFDGVDLKKHIIGDDKTCIKIWTQGQVHSEKQLTWYAYIYYLNKKVIPRLELNCIETTVYNGHVVATGNIKTIATKRTVKDFLFLQKDINKVWKEIVDFCDMEWKSVV